MSSSKKSSANAPEQLTVGLWDPATDSIESADLSAEEFDRLFGTDEFAGEELGVDTLDTDDDLLLSIVDGELPPDPDDSDFDLDGNFIDDELPTDSPEALALADELGLFGHIHLDEAPDPNEHPDITFVRALLTFAVKARTASPSAS